MTKKKVLHDYLHLHEPIHACIYPHVRVCSCGQLMVWHDGGEPDLTTTRGWIFCPPELRMNQTQVAQFRTRYPMAFQLFKNVHKIFKIKDHEEESI